MLAETLGLWRSLLIYYGLPFRGLRLTRFYRQFIRPGDLVFDIGAHVGNHSLALWRAGGRILAFEPQPRCANFLRRWIVPGREIRLVEAGVGAQAGTALLQISRRHPTVSTLSQKFIEQVGQEESFAQVEWDQQVAVPVHTLDQLIAENGLPAFCKIDTEGFEFEILSGLSQPIPALGFEYLPAVRQNALACIKRLDELGDYRYNWSQGERLKLQPAWVSSAQALAFLETLPPDSREGNLYAKLQAAHLKNN